MNKMGILSTTNLSTHYTTTSNASAQCSPLSSTLLPQRDRLKLNNPRRGRPSYNGRISLACRASIEDLPLSADAIAFAPLVVLADISEGGYSQASYYTSLGLFIISVPGIWSLIKRSTKSKIVKKTFTVPGPSAAEQGRAPKQLAGEITSFLTRKNFVVTDRGETVTFEGTIVPSRAQAALLIFCTCVSLASIALVLTITVPSIGDKWYWLSALSPLAGVYYWTRASRKEQIKVKMIVADDNSSTDVILQGDDEEIDMLRRELGFMEKGMVYVKGILER
ncbi:hypothetical protein KP509_22G072900 [Ceratopteris richardii]|uniref:Uncharacterized protein n=1 Tax=Ceratopteris richardii TaxID=49495 RepID=A0A8T2S6C3_CERRI|nr:hypothetical protein KP509_22G072900 [Ceratopteris richardii]